MKRLFISILSLCVLISAFVTGCSNNKQKEEMKYFKVMPSQLEEGEYVICSNELNIVMDKNLTLMRGFSFRIISKEPLVDGDVEVKFNNLSATYNMSPLNSEYSDQLFSKKVLLSYNNFDWEAHHKLEWGGTEEDRNKYFEIENEIQEEYEKISDDSIVKMYITECRININMDDVSKDEDDIIDKMTVIIKGKEYSVDLGKLVLKYGEDKSEYGPDPEYNLILKSGGRYGVNFGSGKDAEVYIPSYDAETKKEIVIKDVRLIHSDDKKSVESVGFSVEGDNSISQKWTSGDEIVIPAESRVSISPNINDMNLIDKLHYSTNVYFEIIYEVDGHLYKVRNQVIGETRYPAEEFYASFKDNVDMMKYHSVNDL